MLMACYGTQRTGAAKPSNFALTDGDTALWGKKPSGTPHLPVRGPRRGPTEPHCYLSKNNAHIHHMLSGMKRYVGPLRGPLPCGMIQFRGFLAHYVVCVTTQLAQNWTASPPPFQLYCKRVGCILYAIFKP